MWTDRLISFSRKHVQNYLRLLPCIGNARNSPFPPRWLEDTLYLSGLERLPGGIMEALKFCRDNSGIHSRYPFFASTVWNWILDHREQASSAMGGGTDREQYLWMLKQVAYGVFSFADSKSMLMAIARLPLPPDLSPDEQKTAAANWRTIIGREFPRLYDEDVLFVNNHLYLLSDSREEKLRILKNYLEFSDEDRLGKYSSVWSERLREHCRQYPEDAAALRMYCMESIRRYEIGVYQCLHDLPLCFGLSRLGAETAGLEAAESWLLNIIRQRFRADLSFYLLKQDEWKMLSRWRPASPSVRSQLLDWWRNLAPDDGNLLFSYRSQALFTLEEDESRLVAWIAGTPPHTRPPVIPSGWLPRCPRLQMQLMAIVTDRLETSLSSSRRLALSPHQEDLWKLLFRLPVSGSQVTRFIRSTVAHGSPDLSCIRNLLRSPGLPADTPLDDIRQTVTTILTHLKHPEEQVTRKTELAFLTAELVREYLRCGASPAVETTEPSGRGTHLGSGMGADTGAARSSPGSAPAMEPAMGPDTPDIPWVNSTIEFITWDENISENTRTGAGNLFGNIVKAMVQDGADTPLSHPGASALVHALWLAGLNHLAKCLSRPELKKVVSTEDILQTLTCLTRQLSPSFLDPSRDTKELSVHSRSGETSWETLAGLVQQAENNRVVLMAVAIGNALVVHADHEQQRQWWSTLCNIHQAPCSHTLSPEETDILRQHFLFHYFLSTFEKCGGKTGGEPGQGPVLYQVGDGTALLRRLRDGMHLFAGSSPADREFWAEIWTEVFEMWKMKHRDKDGLTTGLCVTAGLPPPVFMDKQFITAPAPAGPSGDSGFLSKTESFLPVPSARLFP